MCDNLAKFSNIAENNLQFALPKILKDEPYSINIVDTTKQEQEDSEKFENHTIAQIKEKINSIICKLGNKKLWTDIYKEHLKINGKVKSSYISFYHHIIDYCDQINTNIGNKTKDKDIQF